MWPLLPTAHIGESGTSNSCLFVADMVVHAMARQAVHSEEEHDAEGATRTGRPRVAGVGDEAVRPAQQGLEVLLQQLGHLFQMDLKNL
jgi:hypothetical protein